MKAELTVYHVAIILIAGIGFLIYYLYSRYNAHRKYEVKKQPSSNASVTARRLNTSHQRKDILTSIFNVAERGVEHFNMPISKEGEFELLMFDIWLGVKVLESKNINIKKSQERIEKFLENKIRDFGFPSEKKYERIYLLRCVTDGWENDMYGLAHSDYPRTRQYLPAYLYMCFIKEPLKVYTEDVLERKISVLNITEVADFFMIYTEHHEWLISELNKIE